MQLAVRVPRSLIDDLDALVPGLHPTRAEAVRSAVESYLYRLACEQDAQRYLEQPLDDDELALTEDPSGWDGAPPW